MNSPILPDPHFKNLSRESSKSQKLFVCPECSLSYTDAQWAKKCAAWCKEHHSCNLEIIKHAFEQ